ncbi:hypothetical protein Pmani_029498 [Petrolisthes manimaculis]|uniref:Uncharacterized protein n=1 Tax=Petrolisthes manimaculis TaxID=1843537 RepID=A0AAE1NYK3_9EUCA|nr:hypothetical protein Pmani_029498 [Petrolisthes manimaculis]
MGRKVDELKHIERVTQVDVVVRRSGDKMEGRKEWKRGESRGVDKVCDSPHPMTHPCLTLTQPCLSPPNASPHPTPLPSCLTPTCLTIQTATPHQPPHTTYLTPPTSHHLPHDTTYLTPPTT